MDGEPRPDPPPGGPGGAVVGLAFVGVILCTLFAAGALGVLAVGGGAQHRSTVQASRPAGGVAAEPPTGTVVDRVHAYAGLEGLVRRRQAALRRRDPSMLETVWTPGSPWLARDRSEVERLLSRGRRWEDLRLTVTILDGRSDGDRWLVLARLGRSTSRLVSTGGAVLRVVPSASASYRCELVEADGGWRLVAFRPI